MEYRECKIGRTFVARLREGESIYEEIEKLAEKEGIRCGSVMALGGIRRGRVIVGPEDPSSLKDIVGMIEAFDDARELVGLGTIFPSDGKPELHFHAAIGRGKESLVGCPREEAVCFLVMEVAITEWLGLDAERAPEGETGFRLLSFGGRDC